MPIVYIHGVATRQESKAYEVDLTRRLTFLRRYIAPVIARDPENVAIIPVYWGNHGARFAFGRKSRPLTPLFGMGGEADLNPYQIAMMAATLHETLAAMPEPPATHTPHSGGLVSSGATEGEAEPTRLGDLTPEQLAALLVNIVQQAVGDTGEATLISIAADFVATDPATAIALRSCDNSAEERALVEQLIIDRYQEERAREGGLVGQGVPAWAARLGDRISEVLRRGGNTGGFVLARAAVETVRKPINDLLTLFIGDVFTYLTNRVVTQNEVEIPGPIPQIALDKLAEAHQNKLQRSEPLVVLSHSMGGQIVYDLVTHFLPTTPGYEQIRIDFWCATASQVGLFEELKLFKASTQAYSDFMRRLVPFPNRRQLGDWWNVWDHNDVLSFTVRDIFETQPLALGGVDDEPYDAGMFVGPAHGGYLEQPSFYRRFATKLAEAKARDWRNTDAAAK